MEFRLVILLLLGVIRGSGSQGQSGPYYGLPMGSFYFSRDGTQGDVYAADPRTVIIVNFHQNAKPGCTTLMAGPVRKTDFGAHVAPGRRGIMLPINLPKSVQLDNDASKRRPEFRGARQKRSLQSRLAAFNPIASSMGGNAFDGIQLERAETTTTTTAQPTTPTSTTTRQPTTRTRPTTTTTRATTTTTTTQPTTTTSTTTTAAPTTTTAAPTTTTAAPTTTTTSSTTTSTASTTTTTEASTTTNTPEVVVLQKDSFELLQPNEISSEDNPRRIIQEARESSDPRLELIQDQIPVFGDAFDYNPFGGDAVAFDGGEADAAPEIQFSNDDKAENVSDENQDVSYDSAPFGDLASSSAFQVELAPELELIVSSPEVDVPEHELPEPIFTTEAPTTIQPTTEAPEQPKESLMSVLQRKGLVFIDAPSVSKQADTIGRGLVLNGDEQSTQASTVHYWGPLPRSPDLFITEDDDDFAFYRRKEAEKNEPQGVTAILGQSASEESSEDPLLSTFAGELQPSNRDPQTEKVQQRMLNRHIEIPEPPTLAPGSPLLFRLGGSTTETPPTTKGGQGLFEFTTPKPGEKQPLWYVVEDPRRGRRLRNRKGGLVKNAVPKPKPTPKPIADNLLSSKEAPKTDTPQGVDEEYILPSINGETMVVRLPQPYTLYDFEWFGIYDHCSQLKTAYVRTRDVQPPEEAVVDGLIGTDYGVSSNDIHIINCNTIVIKDFTYQGAHVQDAFIFVGLGDYDHNDVLYQVPAQIVGTEIDTPLPNTDGTDLVVRLPTGFKTFDINFLSVYSPRLQKSYGFATIPPVVVPPCHELE